MKRKRYEQINETLFEETLTNGLRVYLLPKKEYHKVYGLFTVNYGSIDNTFVPLAQSEYETSPDGVAHFLEHKLFDEPDGEDASLKFSALGASSNAFTTFSKTSYLFSTSTKVKETISLLLDFVQTPYFTQESVEKEKGIIAQEIQMYRDDSNWRLFFGILENMYPEHPMSKDIAGTVESIQKITSEELLKCYQTFYQPSNMTLFVVGNFDEHEMIETIRDNQANKTFPAPQAIERFFPEEKGKNEIATRAIQMAVIRPKFVLGLKGKDVLPHDGRALLKYRIALSLFGQALLGETSENYLTLYNEGVLDDTFDEEFSLDRQAHFQLFSGDSEQPYVAVEKIREIVAQFETSSELTEAKIALLKKRMIGKYFQSLNSLEYIANQFSQTLFGEVTLFDMVEIIEALTKEEVLETAKKFMANAVWSEFYILPNEV